MKITGTIQHHKPGSRLWIQGGCNVEIHTEFIAYCCDEMESAFETGHVSFGQTDWLTNRDGNVNLISYDDVPREWPVPMPIRFCPFCAQAIEVALTEIA